MPTRVRGGIGQRIASALHSEGAEVPARVVVLMYREPIRDGARLVQGRTRVVKSWNTLGKAGNAVRQLSLAAARLAYYRRRETRTGEPCRLQVQAWMNDGRRIVVVDDQSTRGVITWKAGELWPGPDQPA